MKSVIAQFVDGWSVDTTIDLRQSGANVLVNVYGDKDVLNQPDVGIGIVGQRNELLGFTTNPIAGTDKPLVNVEIKGARHGDYVKSNQNFIFGQSGIAGIPFDLFNLYYTDENEAWNNRVAEFVAELALNSKSKEDLDAFFADQNSRTPGIAIAVNGGWEVRLPGWNQQ